MLASLFAELKENAFQAPPVIASQRRSVGVAIRLNALPQCHSRACFTSEAWNVARFPRVSMPANGAAAEIAHRLLLPQAAAARNPPSGQLTVCKG